MQRNTADVVNKSIISIKDSIMDVLKEENIKLQSRVEQVEEKLLRIEIAKNNHKQYTWHNNMEIEGIQATVADDHLGNKLIDVFRCFKINIDSSDRGLW